LTDKTGERSFLDKFGMLVGSVGIAGVQDSDMKDIMPNKERVDAAWGGFAFLK